MHPLVDRDHIETSSAEQLATGNVAGPAGISGYHLSELGPEGLAVLRDLYVRDLVVDSAARQGLQIIADRVR